MEALGSDPRHRVIAERPAIGIRGPALELSFLVILASSAINPAKYIAS